MTSYNHVVTHLLLLEDRDCENGTRARKAAKRPLTPTHPLQQYFQIRGGARKAEEIRVYNYLKT